MALSYKGNELVNDEPVYDTDYTDSTWRVSWIQKRKDRDTLQGCVYGANIDVPIKLPEYFAVFMPKIAKKLVVESLQLQGIIRKGCGKEFVVKLYRTFEDHVENIIIESQGIGLIRLNFIKYLPGRDKK